MEPTMIWAVIRRRKWVIVLAAIFVTLGTVLGSHLVTPTYRTSAKILIMESGQRKVGLEGAGFSFLSSLTSIISAGPDTDVNRILATSRPYINRMISKLQLRDEEGNLLTANNVTRSGVISRGPSVSVTRYRDTDILQVEADSSHPQEAKLMANTLAEIMVDENLTQVRAEYQSAKAFLESQMGKVYERYWEALRKITDFKKQEKTLDLEIETRMAAEKMGELLRQKEDNIIDLAEARARLSRLKEHLAKQTPEFVSASTLKESPQIGILKRQLTELKLKLTQARAQFTEQHPIILSLKKEIGMAEVELKEELEVYRSSAPELIILESEISALEAHLKGVNTDIRKYLKSLGEVPEKAYKQANLDMELAVSQKAYNSLLDSLYQISIAEATTLSDIRVIEPAVKPSAPASPKKALNGMLGILVGLVIGLILAFTREYVDDTVKTVQDIKEFKPIPLIGVVPNQKKMRLIWSVDTNDPLYEAYRKIQTHLTIMDHVGEKPLQNLLVTSSMPEEGKSTTVANLAISTCHKGKTVAIVDADLRRPSLHTYFEIPNDVGLADVLQGTIPPEDAIKPTHIEGLSVIPSGSPLPDPGTLVESEKMGQFIADLRGQFDVLIMDSAPLLVKSDALVLAEHMDGTIIVVESGKTTYRAVHELTETLTGANIKPLGFVLNRFHIERGKYYYHQYYYGGYTRKSFAAEANG